jgi:putative sugar O-methyltransferase
VYTLDVLIKTFFRKLSRFFIFNSRYRKSKTSISDDNVYPRFALEASEIEEKFTSFRKSPEIISTLEHVTREQGQLYLDFIIGNNYYSTSQIREMCNEIVGNPLKNNYDLIGEANPTTLRYVKVMGDLEKYFGDISDFRVTEIGIGYGGQARILTSNFNPKEYNLIDLDEVLKLGEKFLKLSTSFESFKYISGNQVADLHSDLVISNYAFSELTRSVQDDYFKKVISNSKRGYVTYNNINPDYFDSYSINEFVERIPNSRIIEEIPLTHPDNKIIIWGN